VKLALILEHWNNVEDKKAKIRLNPLFQHSIIPLFQYSLAQTGFSHGTGYYSDVAPGRANCGAKRR